MKILNMSVSLLLLLGLIGCDAAQDSEKQVQSEKSSVEEKSKDDKEATQEKEKVKEEVEEEVKEDSVEDEAEAANHENKSTTQSEAPKEDETEKSDSNVNTESETESAATSEDTEEEQEDPNATNRIVEDQINIINNQLANNGYPALDDWEMLKYREYDNVASGTYLSAWRNGNVTVSLSEYGEQIVFVDIYVSGNDQASYDELYTLLILCTTNIYFTGDEVDQIIEQFNNGETIVNMNGYQASLDEGNGLTIHAGIVGG